MNKQVQTMLYGSTEFISARSDSSTSIISERDKVTANRELIGSIIAVLCEKGDGDVNKLIEKARRLDSPIELKNHAKDKKAIDNLKGIFVELLKKGRIQDAAALKFFLGFGIGFRRQVETVLEECADDSEKVKKIRESFPHTSLSLPKKPEDDDDIKVPRSF